MRFFHRKPPRTPEIHATPDNVADALAQAERELLAAERQAHAAAIQVERLRQTNIRNGFAVAIRESFMKHNGGHA